MPALEHPLILSILRWRGEKAQTAEKYGADTLMELSTGGDLTKIRKRVLDSISLTVGTVPLYQAAIETNKKKGSVVHMEADFSLTL